MALSTLPRPTTTTADATTVRRSSAPVMGGEAWIVPFEPGAPAWITASAPTISIVDARGAADRP